MKNAYPEVAPDVLSDMNKIGLVYECSSNDKVVFAHDIIAEYCAAWKNTNR